MVESFEAAETHRVSWLVVVVKLPTEPARHRMATWRELRRSGAVLVGSATWAIPDLKATQPVLQRIRELVSEGAGTLIALRADGHTEDDTEALMERYREARSEEWTEFEADCGKYLLEIAHEQQIEKFTLGELEEEEQSLDRLRRWYRDLRRRDLLNTPGASSAAQRLEECENTFEQYAEQVYTAAGAPFRA